MPFRLDMPIEQQQMVNTADDSTLERMQIQNSSQLTQWQKQLQPAIFSMGKQDGAQRDSAQFDQKLTPKKLLNPLRRNGTNIFFLENSNFSFKNSLNQEL